MVARARNVGGSGPTVWQAGHHSAGFSRSETQHVRLSESVPPCIIAHPNPLLIMQVFFFVSRNIFVKCRISSKLSLLGGDFPDVVQEST